MKKLYNKLEIIDYEYIENEIHILIRRTNRSANCPCCGNKMKKIKDKYYRTVKDLPIQDKKVFLKIETKRFVCNNKNCDINTFSESFSFIDHHSRITTRLKDRIINSAKGMSARASKQVINSDIVCISDDTILRLIKKNNIKNK